MDVVTINRAPVLTLWAAVVAECLGFDHDEALTLGKAVEGDPIGTSGQTGPGVAAHAHPQS